MERWDLYTCDRMKTGRTVLRGEEIPEGLYRLVVHLCIFNSRGELLIQQRQTSKATWPGLWDLTVGGHVIAGETSRMAVERETLEELGLVITLKGMRPAVTAAFPNGYDDIYVIELEPELSDLILQDEEVLDIRWGGLKEILSMIDEGSFIPYHKSLIELLFYLRNHPEVHVE